MAPTERSHKRRLRPPEGPVTYRQEYRRCGKPTCSRCAEGQPGHGPYWYAYRWEDGRRHIRYVGKHLPPGTDPASIAAPAHPLQVQTLGAFAVRRGDRLLSLRGRRTASLLKCLLGAPTHRLTREQVVELLWPEADPDRAAASLRTTVHLLRRALDAPGAPSYLRTEGDTLLLLPSPDSSPPDDWLDADTFERLAHDALAGEDSAACRLALERYTGEYLADDRYEVWAEWTRERLHRLHLDLLLHLARLNMSEGEMDRAETCLRQVLESDPGHEEAAAALMTLLTASGRDDEALRVYGALASALEADLDVSPGADVESLRARILSRRAAVTAPEPAASPPPDRTNLPAQLTSFVGRTWELDEISKLFSRSRLVTLTGPGGAGKTRLALETSARLVDRYPQGVWLVELAGIAHPRLVPATVASTLGVEEDPTMPLVETLVRAWRASDMLLLLDNCEHLVDACTALVAALLAGCPALRVLATSREALGVPGEIAHRVPSLAAPDPDHTLPPELLADYEAVQLFVSRAQSQRPDFALTSATAPAVAKICARLEGLPLAIELAAARLSVLPVEAIAQRLDDRFRLLTGGPRTALPRQQTLRATIDWSYTLLDPQERLLLCRLTVFAGSWTLEAAEAVCAGQELPAENILDRLDALSHKSLVVPDDRAKDLRFRMLETIRQYARERLAESGEEAALLHRHAAHTATLAEEAGKQLTGSEQVASIGRLQADLDNIRVVLQWTLDSDAVELGLRVVAPIWRFWMISGQSVEGRRWLEALLALHGYADVSEAVQATALFAVGSLAYAQGDSAHATQLYTRCVELRRKLGDLPGQAEALNGLGVSGMERGDYGDAEQWFEQSLALRSRLGDDLGRHAPLANLGSIARYHGDYRRATDMYEEALEIQRRAGHTQAVLNTLNNLSQLSGDQGNYERAEQVNDEALALARESGIVAHVVTALGTRSAQALEQGDLTRAEACLHEYRDLARSVGDRPAEYLALINLAEVALGRGEPQRAVELAGEALAHLREVGQRRGQAFALATLAEAARLLGDYDRAAGHLEECASIRRELGDALGAVTVLEGRSRLARSRGESEEAVRLYAAADALRTALGTPLPPFWQPNQERDIGDLRATLGRDRFSAIWDEGRQAAPTYVPHTDGIAELQSGR